MRWLPADGLVRIPHYTTHGYACSCSSPLPTHASLPVTVPAHVYRVADGHRTRYMQRGFRAAFTPRSGSYGSGLLPPDCWLRVHPAATCRHIRLYHRYGLDSTWVVALQLPLRYRFICVYGTFYADADTRALVAAYTCLRCQTPRLRYRLVTGGAVHVTICIGCATVHAVDAVGHRTFTQLRLLPCRVRLIGVPTR